MSRPPDLAELGAVALTAAYNVAVNRHLPEATHIPANLAASGALLLLARRAGVDPAALGLAPDAVGSGVRTGIAVGAGAAGLIAAGAAIPWTRRLFEDDRFRDHSNAQVAYHVLLRIPVATALGEELVFRAALLGLLGRGRSRTVAVAATSGLFGLWHVLPTLTSLGVPSAQSDTADRIGRVAFVVGVVAGTAAAGAGFAALRFRSGSILGPALAHAAVNSAALLAARAISRSTTLAPVDPGADRPSG